MRSSAFVCLVATLSLGSACDGATQEVDPTPDVAEPEFVALDGGLVDDGGPADVSDSGSSLDSGTGDDDGGARIDAGASGDGGPSGGDGGPSGGDAGPSGGDAGNSGDERSILPDEVTEDLAGDYVVAEGEVSFVRRVDRGVTLEGSLVVASGATLILDDFLEVEGTLVVEAGAIIRKTDANALLRVDILQVHGTPEAPAEFDGVGAEFNTEPYYGVIFVEAGRVEVDHGNFTQVRFISLGENGPTGESAAGGWIRDSIFARSPQADGMSATALEVHGPGPDALIVEHNTFERTRITLRGADFRNNDVGPINDVDVDGFQRVIVLIGSRATGANPICVGERDQDALVTFEDNVIHLPVPLVAPHHTWMEIARYFGPTPIGANFFDSTDNPVTAPFAIDDWSGSSNGCSDGMGVFGGPVTVEDALTEAPPVGPRR